AAARSRATPSVCQGRGSRLLSPTALQSGRSSQLGGTCGTVEGWRRSPAHPTAARVQQGPVRFSPCGQQDAQQRDPGRTGQEDGGEGPANPGLSSLLASSVKSAVAAKSRVLGCRRPAHGYYMLHDAVWSERRAPCCASAASKGASDGSSTAETSPLS